MKNTPTSNVAAYVRVSTVGQNEAGQRAEIERWIGASGIQGVRWFIDKFTGKTLARPAFERLQAEIAKGAVRTVVVYKLDRLSRSMRDGIVTLCDWCDRGLRVVSVTQAIDFSGTLGKMLASVLLGVAEMENEHRRERQAAGIAVAKKAGKYKGRKPGALAKDVDPNEAARLRQLGNKDDQIARSLGVSRRTVQRYLRMAGM